MTDSKGNEIVFDKREPNIVTCNGRTVEFLGFLAWRLDNGYPDIPVEEEYKKLKEMWIADIKLKAAEYFN